MKLDHDSFTIYSILLSLYREYDSKERRGYAAFLIHQLVTLPPFLDSRWQGPLCA